MAALQGMFPALDASLERIELADLPSPILNATQLAETLGLEQLLVKRDDIAGSPYGGNKLRKLEYLFGEARAKNCDAVLTFGAVGSNHVLATSIYARQLGFKCYAVLTPQTNTPYVANTLRYHAMLGTELIDAGDYAQTLAAAARAEEQHPTGADKVLRITWGGSSWRGTVGFINAAAELRQQLTDAAAPDVIYAACGTMGTVTGLAIGAALANWPTRVEAIQVVPSPASTEKGIATLVDTLSDELRSRDESFPRLSRQDLNLRLREEFLGPGYAETTPECLEAVEVFQAQTGLKLETTYTGKAFAALIQDARDHQLTGQRVLFWDTYNSQPYPDKLSDVDLTELPAWTHHYLPA